MKYVILILALLAGCGGSDFSASGVDALDGAVDVVTVEKDAVGEDAGLDASGGSSGVGGAGGASGSAGSAGSGGVGGSGGAGGAGGASGSGGAGGAGGASGSAGSSGSAGAGGCVPKSCTDLGKNCGYAEDTCGGSTEWCGVCPSPKICGGGGTPNVCGGCKPSTCADQQIQCGSVSDGCGNMLDCGQWVKGMDGQCPQYPGYPYTWICGTGWGGYNTPPPGACKLVTGFTATFCCTQNHL